MLFVSTMPPSPSADMTHKNYWHPENSAGFNCGGSWNANSSLFCPLPLGANSSIVSLPYIVWSARHATSASLRLLCPRWCHSRARPPCASALYYYHLLVFIVSCDQVNVKVWFLLPIVLHACATGVLVTFQIWRLLDARMSCLSGNLLQVKCFCHKFIPKVSLASLFPN